MNAENLREVLIASYPTLNVSVGYIGNVGRGYDDRSWYVWLNAVQVLGVWGRGPAKVDFDPASIDVRDVCRKIDLIVARNAAAANR